MAVIFFDGFDRAMDAHYWTSTNAGFGESVLTFVASDPVTNNARLGNIGTHTAKKLYFGLRLLTYDVKHDQPFLKFYNASGSVVLTLQWNLNDGPLVAYPNVGLEPVLASGATLSPFVVSNSIAGVGFSNGNPRSIFLGAVVLEFELDLTAYTLAVTFNGQPLQTMSAATTLTGLTSAVSEIAGLAIFGGTTSTATVQDMYLIDDTGTFANTWLGNNFAIHALETSPNNSYPVHNTGWVDKNNSSSVSKDDIKTNDGDGSFMRTGTFDKEIAFNLTDISPGGFNPAVAGIRVRSVARRQLLNAAYKHFVWNPSSTTGAEMGTRVVLTNSTYAAQPGQFINVNPLTSAQWTVADVNNTGFGAKSVDPA